MAPTQRSLLTAAIFLVAVELMMSAPKANADPNPNGRCRDDMCLNEYRGEGTGVDLCDPKARLVQYCPALDEFCLAAPCEEKVQCRERDGFCVSDKEDCRGKAIPGLCEGQGCFCCIEEDVEWPTNYFEPSVSVCSGSVSLDVDDIVGIYSPNFPGKYDHDITCSLNLVASERVLLKIEFLHFDLENCEFDSLDINSGSYTLSGRSLPETIFLLTTTTTLTFQTDSTVSNSGFYLKVSAVRVYDICDGSITVNNHGALISPNYPDNYNEDTDCSAVIKAPTGTYLDFHWLDFYVQGTDDDEDQCPYDYLQIYDTLLPTTYEHCDFVLPFFTRSTTNEVQVDFITDDDFEYKGFLVYFTVV